MQVEATSERIKYPGSYSFILENQTPKAVIRGLVKRINEDCPGIHAIDLRPAHLSERGNVFTLPQWYLGLWNPADAPYPKIPKTAVLDWHGLLNEVTFEESAMLDGSMKSRHWCIKDLGSVFTLLNDRIDFTDPYPERSGRLSVSLRGYLPDLNHYEPEPETVEPTRVHVDFVVDQGGTPGPLLRSALGYINGISRDVRVEAKENRPHGHGGYTIYPAKLD